MILDNNITKSLFYCSLILYLYLCPIPSRASEYATKVHYAQLISTPSATNVSAEFEYRLSPTAREALDKGIPLAWDIFFKISETKWPFDAVIYQKTLRYSLQFHALLNQYEVKCPPAQIEMFLTLNAALNFMSLVKDTAPISIAPAQADKHYKLAVKTEFNREFLPIPLRPVAYLDSQWFLSSDWFIWPTPK